MHKVSIITGVFNGNVKYVTDSIDSILNQTYSDFEYIIVDDGSEEEISQLLET